MHKVQSLRISDEWNFVYWYPQFVATLVEVVGNLCPGFDDIGFVQAFPLQYLLSCIVQG